MALRRRIAALVVERDRVVWPLPRTWECDLDAVRTRQRKAGISAEVREMAEQRIREEEAAKEAEEESKTKAAGVNVMAPLAKRKKKTAGEQRKKATFPRVTDREHDMHSLYRKLDEKLYLLVRRDGEWTFPQAAHDPTLDTRYGLRDTAERQLVKGLDAWLIGNVPMHHINGETFFFGAFRTGGNVEKGAVEDFVWATKQEICDKYVADNAELREACQTMLWEDISVEEDDDEGIALYVKELKKRRSSK